MSRPAVYRSFVLGLDGVPWDLLERWAQSGDLPNVQTLLETGASGPLESTLPPSTAVTWPSIATGVRPDKHGIYGIWRLDGSYQRRLHTSADLRQPPLWELLAPAVVVNAPVTYPARDLEGTMVTGMVTPQRDAGFTHPPEFADEMAEVAPGYRIGPSLPPAGRSSFLDDLDDVIASRWRLIKHLMHERDWSLFFAVFTAPDRLQHVLWDEAVLRSYYRQFDAMLGEIIDRVQDCGANLFVLSGHGFGRVSDVIHVNRLLEEAGYLQRRRHSTDGGRSERVTGGFTSIPGRAGPAVDDGSGGAATGPLHTRGISQPDPYRDVRFGRTRVFGHGTRTLYVNDRIRFADGTVAPADRARVKREAMTFLESATRPDGEAPLLRVYDGSELFPTDPKAPDIVVEGTRETALSSVPSGDIVRPVAGAAGAHRSTGALVAWGPNIRHRELADATVYDVAPTLLHGQLNPIPRDVDGRVLDIFSRGTSSGNRAPTYVDARRGVRGDPTGADVIETDRLRGLEHFE